MSGPSIASFRSGIAAVTLLACLPAARRNWSVPVFLASIAYALTLITFAVANKLTTGANVVFLQNTAPLFILVLSILLLQERPSRTDLLFTLPIALGMALFFAGSERPAVTATNPQLGNLIAAFFGALLRDRRGRVSASCPRRTRPGDSRSGAWKRFGVPDYASVRAAVYGWNAIGLGRIDLPRRNSDCTGLCADDARHALCSGIRSFLANARRAGSQPGVDMAGAPRKANEFRSCGRSSYPGIRGGRGVGSANPQPSRACLEDLARWYPKGSLPNSLEQF